MQVQIHVYIHTSNYPHITSTVNVRDLGVTLDQDLTVANHIPKPMPRLLLPAAPVPHHLKLTYFQCYCKSCSLHYHGLT